MNNGYIEIMGAKEHNLKNISVKIPKNKLVAITGPSGSGKSTFAMNILQRECQRQYMESMGLITDGLNKPNVDKIVGLSPAIGVSQRQLSGNKNSTVGTYTEILTYLRILYAKLGIRECSNCHKPINPSFNQEDTAEIDNHKVKCPHCLAELDKLTMASFSFNKPEGACKTCNGLGEITDIDITKIVDENLTIGEGAVVFWSADMFGKFYGDILENCGKHYGFKFDTSKKIKDYSDLERLVFYHGVDSSEFKKRYPNIKPPKKVNDGYFKGVLTFMKEKAHENAKKKKKNSKLTSSFITTTCPECNGSRVGFDGRTVTVKGKTLPEICCFDMKELYQWLNSLALNEDEKVIVSAVISDLKKRIGNLVKIGLTYLSLNRSVSTLSGGEAQRIKLSNIIDSGLTGVLYILDEPTTGLHPHDGKRLLHSLKQIRDLGNTVLVIEHDMDFVNECDHVIDFGPESGIHGGEITAEGSPESLKTNPDSLTGKFLSGINLSPLNITSSSPYSWINVKNAYSHNLKNINVDIPLNTFVCFTGVSGSGKSSLVFDVINKFYEKGKANCDDVEGLWQVNRVLKVDQKPMGRMSRSNVATYTEVFGLIRNLFSNQRASKLKGLKPSSFSFNVKGGRCEKCQGMGVISLDMQFLEDVEIQCPHCKGHRFKKEILEIEYNGLNISQVLDLTVEEAIDHFFLLKDIVLRLENLKEVGLGYLKLGQSTSTLSGGECQRIKLSKELGRDSDKGTLYILDEPTTGLHPKDIAMIMKLLYKLRMKGNTIFVIEHSLDVIAGSEYIIDMGQDGGSDGGTVLASGSVQDIMNHETSYTGMYLRKALGM